MRMCMYNAFTQYMVLAIAVLCFMVQINVYCNAGKSYVASLTLCVYLMHKILTACMLAM